MTECSIHSVSVEDQLQRRRQSRKNMVRAVPAPPVHRRGSSFPCLPQAACSAAADATKLAVCVCVPVLSCPLSSLPTPRRTEERSIPFVPSWAEPIHPSSTSATACYLVCLAVSAATCTVRLAICCCPSFRCLLYLLILPAANRTSIIHPSICYCPLVPLRKRNPAAATYHLSSGTQEPLQCSY